MDVLSASMNDESSMDDLSASIIDTRIVYGFLGAGKTTYIRDCIMNDYFHKYGTTLILCFEQGKETYDEETLLERNVHVAYYDGHNEITEFCLDPIRKYHPDRIYVEMNTKFPDAKNYFPEMMHVTSTVTWLDWATLGPYLANYKQKIGQMVSESQQITFRGCPSKELLAPYSQEFRLMNHRASYLRQDPMGYHEKAFDLFVPYSLDEDKIKITEKEYLIFWLDAADHPEHYDGKLLCFTDPLELRSVADSGWSAGRVVMTCCMSDLQFMSFGLSETDTAIPQGGWVTMEATGRLVKDGYGRSQLKLEPQCLANAAALRSGILIPGGRGPKGPSQDLSTKLFQQLSVSKPTE